MKVEQNFDSSGLSSLMIDSKDEILSLRSLDGYFRMRGLVLFDIEVNTLYNFDKWGRTNIIF